MSGKMQWIFRFTTNVAFFSSQKLKMYIETEMLDIPIGEI